MAGFRPRGSDQPELELDSGPAAQDSKDGAVPELTLDLPVPPARVSKPSVPSPSPSGRSALDDMDDEEEAHHAAIALEIDTSGIAPLPAAISAPPPPTSQRSLPPTSAPVSAPPAERTSMPTPALPPGVELQVDPYDARAVADYEPEPSSFLITPIYAFRVLRRRAELRELTERAREKSERAKNEALDALVALGERLVPLAPPGIEAVQAAEQVLLARDSALAGETENHKARLAEIEARLAISEKELATAQAGVAAVQAEIDVARQNKARIEAKIKRAEIEMRNAEAGTELDIRASQTSADELLHATSVIVAIETRMTEARRVASASEGRTNAIRGEQRTENERFQRQLATRSSGFSEARNAYRNALADLSRSLLGSQTVPQDLDAYRKDAVHAAERAHKAAVELRLHEVGIDSFSKAKVATGIAVAAVAAFVLVLLLLFPFIYRSFVNG